MKDLELFMKAIESLEGLNVSFKIGKESELVIKGDFTKMMKAVGTLMQREDYNNMNRNKIDVLERELREMKDRAREI